MPLDAIVLVLCAAFLHAGWNTLLVRAPDPRLATAVAMAVCLLISAPLSLLDLHVDADVWPYLLASTLLETAYVLLLAHAYESGAMSVVYPTARGSAPIVGLLLTMVITVALPSLEVAIGIGVIVAGILAVRGLAGNAEPRDVLMGTLIGWLIGGYGVADAAGLRHAAALPYLFLDMILPALVGLAVVLRRAGRARVRAAVDRYAILAGVGTTAVSVLVLVAFARVPTALVPAIQAIRETSVVIGVALAAIVLREPVTRLRVAGAGIVVVGVVIVALA